MTQFFMEYGLFFMKTATVLVAIILVVIVSLNARHRSHDEDQLDIKKLNDKFDEMRLRMNKGLVSSKKFKKLRKAEKQEKKKLKSVDNVERKRLFVLNFHGDIGATAVVSLREEITAILLVAQKSDEVLVRLESGGGLVHSYGLAASQLQRLKNGGVSLTVAVDKVAASGGYMMACVADKILCAPFAIIGSIGVLAQLPNFNRLLRKHDIDFEQIKGGEYKRTLTMFGENTEEGREKMQTDIDQTHQLFKDFIVENRGQVDIKKVATGEHWYGTQAKSLDLVDEIETSDDFLVNASKNADVLEIVYTPKKALKKKFLSLLSRMTDHARNIV